MRTNKIIQSVRANFNTISQHFSHTRQYIWPDIKAFMPKIKAKDKVLDLGCGNGRMLSLIKQKGGKAKNYLGVDFSQNLIAIAQKNYPRANFMIEDFTKKSLWKKVEQKGGFNLVLCIASLHHVPQKKQHKLILKQAYEEIHNNGYLLISVWNLWRKKFVLLHLKQMFNKLFRGKLKDLWIKYSLSDGKKTVKQIKRYHYAFTAGELKKELKKAGFKIIKQKTKGKNIIFLGQKR